MTTFEVWLPTAEQVKIMQSLGAKFVQKHNGTIIWVVN